MWYFSKFPNDVTLLMSIAQYTAMQECESFEQSVALNQCVKPALFLSNESLNCRKLKRQFNGPVTDTFIDLYFSTRVLKPSLQRPAVKETDYTKGFV